MKKQYISKVEAVEFDSSKFGTEGDLPTTLSVNARVAELSQIGRASCRERV